MEETLIPLFENAPYLVSFVAGILTFLSPCVLPLLPAYLSYISGVSVTQLKTGEMGVGGKANVMRSAFMFVLGFGVVFVLLGAAMANLIGDMFQYQAVSYIAGAIIIVFGLHVARVITIPFLNYETRADFGTLQKREGRKFKALAHYFAPFMLGLSFALGWSPCVGPILASILSIAAQEQAKAVTLMSIYAIGLAIPFLLSAILTNRALKFLNRVKASFGIIEKISGALLVFIGIMIASGGIGRISALLQEVIG